ncbi:hypothetical protein ACUOFC_58775, partial [Escherichia sp. TWPC-MK]
HAGIAHWHMQPAFQQLPELRAQLETVDSAPVQALREKMGEFAELRDLLERAIIDTPPVLVRDGGVIASGYNEELDNRSRRQPARATHPA